MYINILLFFLHKIYGNADRAWEENPLQSKKKKSISFSFIFKYNMFNHLESLCTSGWYTPTAT